MVMSPTLLSRRKLLVTGSAAVISAPFVARPGFAQTTESIATIRSSAKSWLWAAEDYAQAGGFFTKANVAVTSTATNRGTNIAALQGGGVDIVIGSLEEPVRSNAGGLQIKVFASSVNKWATHVLLKKEIMDRAGVTEASPLDKKLALLKGLKIGTTGPGASPDAMARYLAFLGGLNPDRDLQLVTTGNGPPQIAALQQNAVDGIVASSPTSNLAILRGGAAYLFQNVLNPPPALKQFQFIVATTHAQTLTSKREALVRYTHGLALALADIHAKPDAFKTWSRGFLFTEETASLFEPAFRDNSDIYFKDPRPTETLFQANLDITNTVNKGMGRPAIPDSVTFASLFDASIAADAMKRL